MGYGPRSGRAQERPGPALTARGIQDGVVQMHAPTTQKQTHRLGGRVRSCQGEGGGKEQEEG